MLGDTLIQCVCMRVLLKFLPEYLRPKLSQKLKLAACTHSILNLLSVHRNRLLDAALSEEFEVSNGGHEIGRR